MRRFAAVLFDVDGTVLDSAEFIYRAFEHVLSQRGFPARTRAEILSVIGPPLPECYRALTGCGADLGGMCREHRNFQKAHLDLPRLFPNTLSTLEQLQRAGIKIAAVTTRSRVSSVATLERCGIAGFFTTVISAEDVVHLKPHAEPLHKALKILDAQTAQALMVGDTETDVLAGKNAGTATAGALYGFHGQSLRAHAPDYLIEDIGEVLRIVAG